MTCQFDLLSDEEFLSKNAEKGWDYLDELAQKPQFCELTEIEIEPLFINEGVILALKETSEVKWDDEPDFDCTLDLPTESEVKWDDEPDFDCAPQEDSSCTLDMPFHEKTFEAHATSTSIESAPPQEFERVELIDFLGVDNYDCVYNPLLLNLVNTLKMNLVRIIHLVELNFVKQFRRSQYSKYLILWYGRDQFLSKSLEWSDLCIMRALQSKRELHLNMVKLIMFCWF